MSRSARDGKGSVQDFYETPAKAARPLVEELYRWSRRAMHPAPRRVWLDPGAGRGALTKVIREYDSVGPVVAVERPDADDYLGQPSLTVRAQLQEAGAETVWMADYLRTSPPNVTVEGVRANLCVCNPPFSLAARFIEHTLDLMELLDDSVVHSAASDPAAAAFLVNVHVFGSTRRREFWQRVRPPDAQRWLVPRPKFRKVGSDATEYVWIVWTNRPQLFEGPSMQWYDTSKFQTATGVVHSPSTAVENGDAMTIAHDVEAFREE